MRKLKDITKDQSRDTGMALVLLFLLIAASRKKEGYLYIAMALHVINMIKPQVYQPFAVIWLGLSDLMGAIMSRVLLSIVFFLVVTPISLIRRILGKDSLRLRAFKAGTGSAMVERNHLFVGEDLERPY
jgi:Saxitoxin biosynthesis operon protein SxtJ